ncbi:PorT family protein [Pontibacter sp. Tf4]|uniref:porin family protein n=1 Tax=Pontibacter sp. Tf4 TaxID=2761620 RepID=UPI00162A89CA|nr:porin family protein [Pontibacter sp. Tf4]MBB6612589.1 PorT family protein [Pontibacter sp. Tf4]
MKRILLLICFFSFALGVSAQQLGVKAGATYATFRGADAKNYDHRLGYSAGLFYQQHINDLIGIQIEALYTSRGAKVENVSSTGVKTEDKFRMNYVDVPLLLHFSAGGLFFDLGPQASFIAKARRIIETTSADGNTTTTKENNITDHPYTVDLGYAAGIGYRGASNIGLEVRYTGGLKDIDDEGPFVNQERHNSTIFLMLSYLF